MCVYSAIEQTLRQRFDEFDETEIIIKASLSHEKCPEWYSACNIIIIHMLMTNYISWESWVLCQKKN